VGVKCSRRYDLDTFVHLYELCFKNTFCFCSNVLLPPPLTPENRETNGALVAFCTPKVKSAIGQETPNTSRRRTPYGQCSKKCVTENTYSAQNVLKSVKAYLILFIVVPSRPRALTKVEVKVKVKHMLGPLKGAQGKKVNRLTA